jgi:hypothetical protein
LKREEIGNLMGRMRERRWREEGKELWRKEDKEVRTESFKEVSRYVKCKVLR